MNTNGTSRAVSPVVGVILVVAITVALSRVVGVFVFDLGQSVSDSKTDSNLGTRTTYSADGNATVQIVTGEADKLRVLVNGTEADNITNPSPGDSVTVQATTESSITVVSEQNGKSTVVSSSGSTTTDSVMAPTDGLVAHWKLTDDSTPDTAINEIDSNDGAVYQASYATSTERGTVLDFDGSSSSVNASPSGGNVTYSHASWVYLHSNSSWVDIVTLGYSGNDNPLVRSSINGDSITTWIRGDNDLIREYSTSTSLTTGEWHHIVWVRDGTSDERLYLDGTPQPVTYQRTEGIDGRTIDRMTLGANQWFGNNLHGQLSDVRVYNRNISDQEVADLYNATK